MSLALRLLALAVAYAALAACTAPVADDEIDRAIGLRIARSAR